MFPRLIDRMEKKKVQILAPLVAVVCLLAFVAFEGCERKPDEAVPQGRGGNASNQVYVSRTEDPAYSKALKDQVAQQKRTAMALAKIKRQMDDLKERARAKLGKDATEEQIKAELDGNPAKYAGWKLLVDAYAKANAKMEKELADVRGIVRRRIEKEAADQKAVAEGKATAVPVASK